MAHAPVVPKNLRALGEWEKRVIDEFIRRNPVAREPDVIFGKESTFGERLADRVASFGGSWTFIGLFVLVMATWISINIIGRAHFDPYPFILLNLVLSCLAALQAPVIMMSQNRQGVKDRLAAQHDYEVNLKAELEISSLHLKFDELRDRQWAALVDMQRQQIELLTKLINQ